MKKLKELKPCPFCGYKRVKITERLRKKLRMRLDLNFCCLIKR